MEIHLPLVSSEDHEISSICTGTRCREMKAFTLMLRFHRRTFRVWRRLASFYHTSAHGREEARSRPEGRSGTRIATGKNVGVRGETEAIRPLASQKTTDKESVRFFSRNGTKSDAVGRFAKAGKRTPDVAKQGVKGQKGGVRQAGFRTQNHGPRIRDKDGYTANR